MMIQTDNPDRQVDRDFENAVMQAIVELKSDHSRVHVIQGR